MMAIPKNIHAGHRNRLRTRFLENGLESFQEHQVLELLLFYAIPRKDTNAISHVLLQRFGSMPKALQASQEELKECQISDNAATFLHLMHVACEAGKIVTVQCDKPVSHPCPGQGKSHGLQLVSPREDFPYCAVHGQLSFFDHQDPVAEPGYVVHIV